MTVVCGCARNLHKGCYRGQETVARVHNMGRPPRRLVLLHLDGSGHLLPEPGAAVLVGGAAVGAVTSVARHHELGPIALALVKRGTPVDVPTLVACAGGDVSATQEELVGAAGESVDRPAPRGPVARLGAALGMAGPLARPGP